MKLAVNVNVKEKGKIHNDHKHYISIYGDILTMKTKFEPIQIIQVSKISTMGNQRTLVIQEDNHKLLKPLEDKKYKCTLLIEEIS